MTQATNIADASWTKAVMSVTHVLTCALDGNTGRDVRDGNSGYVFRRVLKSWFSGGDPEQGFRRCLADGLNKSLVSSAVQATL